MFIEDIRTIHLRKSYTFEKFSLPTANNSQDVNLISRAETHMGAAIPVDDR